MVLSEAGGQTIRYWEPGRANIPTNGFIITQILSAISDSDQAENTSNNLGQYQPKDGEMVGLRSLFTSANSVKYI